MENDYIITTDNLTKAYNKSLALDRVSIGIHKGEILGLVGKNGAGKTTLIRILSGIVKPTSGTFSLFGDKDPKHLPSLLKNASCMIEHPALYDELSGKDNLIATCLIKGMDKEVKSGYIQDRLNFVGLGALYNSTKKVKDYSLGMKQRLGIAMATIGDPKLMMLDEPTNGLDPQGIKEIRDLLVNLNKEKGVTILISSHILPELSKFATSYAFIDKGHILKSISEFELEKEVGKDLMIQTNDNAKAFSLLSSKGYSVTNDGVIYIKKVDDSAAVLNILNTNQLTINFFKEKDNTLEDYYMNLLGGNKNV